MSVTLNPNAGASFDTNLSANAVDSKAENFLSTAAGRQEFLASLSALKAEYSGQSTPTLDRIQKELAAVPENQEIPKSTIGDWAADLLAEILKNFKGGRELIENIKKWFKEGGGAELLKQIQSGMHVAEALGNMLKLFGVPMELVEKALKFMDDSIETVKRFLRDIGVDPESGGGGGGGSGTVRHGDTGRSNYNYTAADLLQLARGDLETAVMAAYIGRAQMQESQLRDQLAVIQSRNASIAELNQVTQAIRQWAKEHKDKDGNVDLTQMPKINGQSVVDILKNYNISFTDQTKVDPTGLCDGTIKAVIDNLNSTQQLEMTRMQSLMNKRNEAYDMVTNFVKTCHDKIETVVNNMR